MYPHYDKSWFLQFIEMLRDNLIEPQYTFVVSEVAPFICQYFKSCNHWEKKYWNNKKITYISSAEQEQSYRQYFPYEFFWHGLQLCPKLDVYPIKQAIQKHLGHIMVDLNLYL